VRELAVFASSEAGKAFARIEDRWGRDPARSLEDEDDVLAHNLRAAFVMALADDSDDEVENGVEKAKQAAREIQGRMNG
jgi:N-acyl-D-aspartate/D-glutamate deacylase